MAMAASFGSWRQGVPVETLSRVLVTLVWFFFYGLVCFAFSYYCFLSVLTFLPGPSRATDVSSSFWVFWSRVLYLHLQRPEP
jgi:hypothetical protein